MHIWTGKNTSLYYKQVDPRLQIKIMSTIHVGLCISNVWNRQPIQSLRLWVATYLASGQTVHTSINKTYRTRYIMLYNTLPEANIGPENRPLERKFLLETTIFEAMLVLGSVYHATCQPCHPANPAPELSLNSSIISLPVFWCLWNHNNVIPRHWLLMQMTFGGTGLNCGWRSWHFNIYMSTYVS